MDKVETHNDADLIERLKGGEKQALDSLMQRYQKPVYFFILRYVHNEDLAYDLTQESFFRVYTRVKSYKSEYRFSTWLYQIALNLCRDHGRKQSLRKFFSFNDEQVKGNSTSLVHKQIDIERKLETDREIELLHGEIAKLPHKLKSALILYSLEEKSQADCSEILGVSKKAVETRVYRAKKILEQKIKEKFKG